MLWAYDGFADLSFASGEVRDPQRTLPRAIIVGTLAIVAIYLAANAAYLYVTPVAAMAGSRLIAADTMEAVIGPAGADAVAAAVAISAFGALIATMLVAPRVFFAMAEDGLFFRRVARVHPRYGTPYVAIALAAALGVCVRADADVRAAGRHVRPVDLAVLRSGGRRTVPPAPAERSAGTTGYPAIPGCRSPSSAPWSTWSATRWLRIRSGPRSRSASS